MGGILEGCSCPIWMGDDQFDSDLLRKTGRLGATPGNVATKVPFGLQLTF